MIKPTKYTNVDFSVIGVSAEILMILRGESIQRYDQILGKLVIKKGRDVKENFLSALCFLYLMGQVHYYPEEDAIELLSHKD